MKLSGKQLQVHHYPQLLSLTKSYAVDVTDEYDAFRIINMLADQHCWLFKHQLIPDYSNTFSVVMWDASTKEWTEYWNEAEQMNWDDLEAVYEEELTNKTT